MIQENSVYRSHEKAQKAQKLKADYREMRTTELKSFVLFVPFRG
jgi:hypothetical protein